jgi:hypothetical protein
VGIAEVHNMIVGGLMADDPAPPHIATAETALAKVLSVAPIMLAHKPPSGEP